MSYNGSGTFLINTAGQPVVSGTVISSTAFNSLTADLATGLSTAITKDGQTTVTANIPMSTYKFTGLGVGSAATDSANLSQVQSTVTKLLNSVSGADTITATASPTLAAYAAGQMFYFVAAGDNTTSVTLNIDSLGAKAVTRDGSVALAAADVKSGEVVVVVYDGTRFQVVSQLNSAGDARFANVSIASSLYVGGVAAITGATTIGGNLTLSGGTANGVLYLNGSKVATSGTALEFSGTNFGVGTSGNTINHRSVIYFAGANAVYQQVANGSTGLGATNGLRIGLTAAGVGELYSPTALVTYIDNSEQMRLTSTGLGIGTASPATKLEVTGDITQTWAASMDRFVGSKFSTTYELGLHFIESTRETRIVSKAADSTGLISFYTGATPTERARITANGELCIGTTATTSSARLDVKGVDTTGTNYCVFFENSGSALLLAVQNDGRWRSGTAAASPYNYVVGSTNRDLFVDNGGDIGYVSSVRASKTNITPDVDTDWLLQLNPVTFNFRKRDEDGNYTDEADGPIKHGLIAEEVEQVNADLCFYDDADKGGALRGVNYSHLITPMLKLIQKQQAAIAMLEAKVSALEAK